MFHSYKGKGMCNLYSATYDTLETQGRAPYV